MVKGRSDSLLYWATTIGHFLEKAESAFSARLPQEKYRGIVDLARNIRPNATDAEIAQALVSFENMKESRLTNIFATKFKPI